MALPFGLGHRENANGAPSSSLNRGHCLGRCTPSRRESRATKRWRSRSRCEERPPGLDSSGWHRVNVLVTRPSAQHQPRRSHESRLGITDEVSVASASRHGAVSQCRTLPALANCKPVLAGFLDARVDFQVSVRRRMTWAYSAYDSKNPSWSMSRSRSSFGAMIHAPSQVPRGTFTSGSPVASTKLKK
jgi:hypothetical protein